MKQTPSEGAWVVLLGDDEEFLDRLVAVLATEWEAREFVSEVADQFDGSLDYGFFRFGWRFDTGSSGYNRTVGGGTEAALSHEQAFEIDRV